MDNKIRTARNVLFQELKPCCVELSQIALRGDSSQAGDQILIPAVTKSYSVLDTKCRRDDGVFDQKLADYVFFPLSQILQRRKQHTGRVSELTLKCVNILLEYGWKTIELDLAKQLLILYTFVAGGVPGKPATTSSEEITSVAYIGLNSLLRDVSRTPGGAESMIDSGTLPALGHSLTVMLEGVTDGASTDVQVHALDALEAVWRCVKDAEALAGFLPGTISGLTKCLIPTSNKRRTKNVLVKALQVLQLVIITCLGDIQTRNIRVRRPSNDKDSDAKEQGLLSQSWLKATAAQIRIALSNIIHLRKHESNDVKSALYRMCLKLLDECHETLSESAEILIDTSMTLNAGSTDSSISAAETSLVDLATIYPDITTHIKSIVYNWIISLPRVMQGNDEKAKLLLLEQLSGAHDLFSSLSLESNILEDSLSNALRDSITLTLDSTASPKHVEEVTLDLDSQAALSLITDARSSDSFQPIIFPMQTQKHVLGQFKHMLSSVGTNEMRLSLARSMLDYAQGGASGTALLSSFWLALELLQSLRQSSQEFDEFFDSSLSVSSTENAFQEELYSYSLGALTESEGSQDWRIQAIGLEVITSVAQQQKQEFRSELIEVLFPITQLLGSAHSHLREHVVTSLNLISTACGYASASDMIVSNADYMVNSVSLRLNTFDISPSTPQVLVMMIRLTGPSLLPYLDDVVGSLFSALDNFHGYPMLVESLFSVLGEIVAVGSKSDLLEIEHTEPISKFLSQPKRPTTEDIISMLRTKRKSEFGDVLEHEDFPHKPWKSAKTLLDEAALPEQKEDGEEPVPEQPSTSEEVVVPPTRTHSLVRRITHQTQHHLTSSSPQLRTRLLRLVQTSSLTLPSSSIDFLPLINDIWPVVLARLYDPEPYVSIAAAEALCAICRSAGDFLNTRFKTEWSSLTRYAGARKLDAAREKKGQGGRGMYSMASKVWEAVVVLLADVVGWVGVSDKMFDDVVEIIGVEMLEKRRDLVEMLSGGRGNADAVWLSLELAKESKKKWRLPQVEGYRFAAWPASVMS